MEKNTYKSKNGSKYISERFAKRLNEILSEKKMKRSELSRLSGVTLERYKIKEDMRSPNLESLVKIADALEVSLDELCGRTAYVHNDDNLTAYECWRILNIVIDNMHPLVRVTDVDAEGITLEFPCSNVTEIYTSAERYEASYSAIKEFDPDNHPLDTNDAKMEYMEREALKLKNSHAQYDAFYDSRYGEIEYEPNDDGNDSPPPSSDELPF